MRGDPGNIDPGGFLSIREKAIATDARRRRRFPKNAATVNEFQIEL